MPILSLMGMLIECELVIFDMSGTLIDEKPRFRGLAQARVQVLRRLVGEEAVVNWADVSGVNLGTWEIDDKGPLVRASRREDLIAAAASLYVSGYGWEEAKDLAKQAYDEADEVLTWKYEPSLFTGIEDGLRRLREAGMRLAVATNDRHVVVEETMRATGVLGFFDVVVGADDVENPKPSPEMILLACERCGCPPSRAVYVGDQTTDTRVARAAGVKAVIAVSPGAEPSPELQVLSDIYIKSVSDFQIA